MTVGVKASAPTSRAADSGATPNRGEAADAAILDATIEVLGEQGYGGLTVSAVIERAGVSSATLYRRWPTKLELVMAAIEYTPSGKSLRRHACTRRFAGTRSTLTPVTRPLSVENAPPTFLLISAFRPVSAERRFESASTP